MLYVGGLRPRHVVTAYEDLGMEIVGTGYEFGHSDDYQRTGHYVKEGTLIYDDVTGYELEKFIETHPPRSGRLRHQGEVPGAEDGHPVPSDALAGTTPARITATTASRSSPATWILRSTTRSGACSRRRGRSEAVRRLTAIAAERAPSPGPFGPHPSQTTSKLLSSVVAVWRTASREEIRPCPNQQTTCSTTRHCSASRNTRRCSRTSASSYECAAPPTPGRRSRRLDQVLGIPRKEPRPRMR